MHKIFKKQELSSKSYKGPKEFFTGEVYIQPLFNANENINASGAYVTFQPKARTAWHIHPKGQWLIVTNGEGVTQYEDGTKEFFSSGDVIYCSSKIKHWHGATENSSMTHIAITGADENGKLVDWLNYVTDDEYLSGTKYEK